MSALKAILSHINIRGRGDSPPAVDHRRQNEDRRKSDRRGNILPFYDREKRLRFAALVAGFGTYDLDCASGDTHWSPELKAIAGLPETSEPVSLQEMEALIHPDDRRQVLEKLQASLAPGGSGEFEAVHRLVRPDGTVRWVRVLGRTFFTGSGESRRPLGAAGVVVDITEHRQAEDALRQSRESLDFCVAERTDKLIQANEALERSNLELQQFAFIAAHDLQTPLRSISGFAQLLKQDYEGRLDPQADAWLDQMARSAHRMRDVINDVLIYSRVESQGNAFRPIDFRRLFDDVLATLDAPIRETGAQVTRDDLPIVLGDRGQLAQVLQNLIDNALKYRGDIPRVHVSARREGEDWVFSVRDNGIGIADHHLENIFDIFRRLHTQQEYPGTGIGLAICRRVIHRHDGRIWVESRQGEGSTFYFTLPDRQREAP